MLEKDRAQSGGAADYVHSQVSLRTVELAIHRCVRLFDPWPGYAASADDLKEMLTARYPEVQRKPGPRTGLDELLDRHRHILSRPSWSSSEEWLV